MTKIEGRQRWMTYRLIYVGPVCRKTWTKLGRTERKGGNTKIIGWMLRG